jgi:CDP-paratose 2-epimerase
VRMGKLSGQAFNVGGGPRNTTSLRELVSVLERLHGRAPTLRFDPWRVGDQRYYASDTRKLERATGWTPRVPLLEGVRRLSDWLREAPTLSEAAPMQLAT